MYFLIYIPMMVFPNRATKKKITSSRACVIDPEFVSSLDGKNKTYGLQSDGKLRILTQPFRLVLLSHAHMKTSACLRVAHIGVRETAALSRKFVAAAANTRELSELSNALSAQDFLYGRWQISVRATNLRIYSRLLFRFARETS